MNTDKALQLYKNGSENYRLICMYAYDLSKSDMKGFHVHHIDGNHKNNHPSNLLRCTPEEHAEIHKDERLSKWISLQHYAAVKGGKIAGKISGEKKSNALRKAWGNLTAEERAKRVKNATSAANTPENNKKRSEKLKGIKRPPRTKEHQQNWLESRSIGLWIFGDREFLSSTAMAKELGVGTGAIRKWCRENDTKITKRGIMKNPQIFNMNDLGKTFKFKGFCFLKKPLGGKNE